MVKLKALSRSERQQRQQVVYQHLLRNSDSIASPNFKTISAADLGLLFHTIDENFFDGRVANACESKSYRPLSFRLSTRMTSAGGMTTMHRTTGYRPRFEFQIAIATTPLFETFKLDATGIVGGLVCRNRLEALQRIMEHEMVHLIEMLIWGDSNCAAKPFREIVGKFFGHSESNHQLLTPQDVARRKLGISVGDQVVFAHDGQSQVGFVNRISKRATVLVESSQGTRYNDGKHYRKFYVPLNRLKRLSSQPG